MFSKQTIAALVAAILALAFTATPASAERQTTCQVEQLKRNYTKHYYTVAHTFDRRTPGRNIRRHGLSGKRKSACRHLAESNRTLKRMLAPPPAPVVAVSAAGGSSAAVVPSSGGGGGTYCGLFQFDQQTWESVGGSGSPCAASESEQWSRAEELQRQRGNQPWPVCGQNGASLEEIVQCESGGDPGAVGP